MYYCILVLSSLVFKKHTKQATDDDEQARCPFGEVIFFRFKYWYYLSPTKQKYNIEIGTLKLLQDY